MNLSRLFKWNKEETLTPVVTEEPQQVDSQQVSNVIPLPINTDKEEQTLDEYLAKPKQSPVKGLMNATEIKEFFSENYFGLGRHNGANFRSLEALELGKKTLISKFQNTLTDLLENKQAQINKLKNYKFIKEENIREQWGKFNDIEKDLHALVQKYPGLANNKNLKN